MAAVAAAQPIHCCFGTCFTAAPHATLLLQPAPWEAEPCVSASGAGRNNSRSEATGKDVSSSPARGGRKEAEPGKRYLPPRAGATPGTAAPCERFTRSA